tara:strand:- start:1366 stop:2106 length:741 start_codon:yes stop_codon:yes gene_type:complete
MKIIISPAKKLNKDAKLQNDLMNFTFLNKSKILVNQLKNLSLVELKELMGTSDNLSQLNYDRFQKWDCNNKNTYKSIDLFNGAVYESMDIDSFSAEDHSFAQLHIRILSGLYGVLTPQDLILPYRLEMGTKFKNSEGDNLYAYWGNMLHNHLSSEIAGSFLINLASDEYSKSLKMNKLNCEIITPVFKDFKNGKLKVISFFAKKARGLMCNFIIKNKITKIDDLKLFSLGGYSFSSVDNNSLIFTR